MRLKVRGVAGHEREFMDLGRGGIERVDRMDRSAAGFAARHESAPFIGNRSVDPDDSALESQRQIVPEPLIEPPPAPRGQALNAVTQLGERHDAQENLVLLDLRELLDDPCVGLQLRPLGDDVRVEEKAHRPVARSRSFDRGTFTPEPRSGEALKKSAREPLRWVRRSHSSTSTITAVRRPLRVMVWGPRVWAFSMTSLSLAFA